MNEYSREEQEEAFKKNASIKVGILFQMLQIIELANKRNLFKASELSYVGSIYDSINERVEKALLTVRNENANGKSNANANANTNANANANHNANARAPTHVPAPPQQNQQVDYERMMQEREMQNRNIGIPNNQPIQINQPIQMNQPSQLHYQPNIEPEPQQELPDELKPQDTRNKKIELTPQDYGSQLNSLGLARISRT
jgi:hypothetical protein